MAIASPVLVFRQTLEQVWQTCNLVRGELESVFQLPRKKIAEIIKPWFDWVVKQPGVKLSKMDVSYRDLLCISGTAGYMYMLSRERCHCIFTGRLLMKAGVLWALSLMVKKMHSRNLGKSG